MTNHRYIYSFKYDIHNRELCKLESRQIFDEEEKNNLLFSDIKVDPSISPFIKNRFEIISSSADYSMLLKKVKEENIRVDGFKAEYMVLDGDSTIYTERLSKLKDIGYCIEGDPDYITPLITYSICNYKNTWYFGVLKKHNTDWFKHKKKPCSFSSSINMDIAKALVSIASKGNKANRLLDACCGVGTVMLEACISEFDIEGCDINWKACKYTRENLAHYNYAASVYRSDIKDINNKYDAAIIDLPYNLYTSSNDTINFNIIESASKLATRIVIVSTSDIKTLINKSELKISDFCSVEKKGKKFSRNIWVCERI
ncbi:TRM11 family SAM-dependent methyltransferase [Sunxiuqinia sp. A32]|uniref:TRM11 family SAM-dependent methyltransferase n=1 Tax=Sunxiuqinia sp. A32 TaxID=3461496 RepID=UPI0040462806